MVLGCVPPMVKCKCRHFLTWLLDVFLPWSDVSAGPFLGWYMVCPTMSMDVSVGKDFLTSLFDVFLIWSNISAEDDKYLHGG